MKECEPKPTRIQILSKKLEDLHLLELEGQDQSKEEGEIWEELEPLIFREMGADLPKRSKLDDDWD